MPDTKISALTTDTAPDRAADYVPFYDASGGDTNKVLINTLLGGDSTSWTPVLAGTTAAGTGTYSTQTGRYVRIGSTVFFHLVLIWTAHTGTGNMIITGLPATSANTILTPCTVRWDSITLPAVGDKILAWVPANSTQITIHSIASGASAALAMDTAGSFWMSGFYFTA